MKSTGRFYLGVFLAMGLSLGAFAKDPHETSVTLREVARVLTLAPGESDGVPSACLAGETVVGGGPTGIPGQVDIVYSTLFFDGAGSGWQVQWKNNGADAVTVEATVGALCVKGTLKRG